MSGEVLPTAYADCHAHGATERYCVAPDGEEVEVVVAGTETEHSETGSASEEAEGENCHFHAGVEYG